MGIVQSSQDRHWMEIALRLARKANSQGEVPVGAILVSAGGELLAKAGNLREALATPLGHAELVALHRGSKKLKSWRLEDCTLYVTLEPCIMCAGAILQARVGRVVFGAQDAKAGAVNSLYNILGDSRLNHQVKVTSGVLEKECSELLTSFFEKRRNEIKQEKLNRNYRLRSSVIVIHKNKILGFRAQDHFSNAEYFFMPGGKIEPGESPTEAAERETLEETGYKIRVLKDTELRKKYDFIWNGTKNHCDTFFYLGVLSEEWHEVSNVKDADCHRGVEWISIKSADKIFAYSPEILTAVQKLVKLARKKRL